MEDLKKAEMALGRGQTKTLMITQRNSVNNGVLYEQIQGTWSL